MISVHSLFLFYSMMTKDSRIDYYEVEREVTLTFSQTGTIKFEKGSEMAKLAAIFLNNATFTPIPSCSNHISGKTIGKGTGFSTQITKLVEI